jgi:hypothetical protein
MSTIVTRAGKGSPLTHTEVDNNFTNLNTDKYQSGNTIIASAGTVSAPALSTTGDTNTGIFFPAADTIAFTEGGVESLRIDSSGNVGIGVTSMSYPLDVKLGNNQFILARESTSNINNGFRIGGSNNENKAVFSADSSTGEVRLGAINTNYFLTFTTNGTTERMRIPAAGGVQAVTTISVGNATPSASGAGITFPASQSASSDANTLDDYEEGTWTPVIESDTVGSGRVTSIQSANYTKIGNTVFVQCYVILSTLGTGGSGSLVLTGLPFVNKTPSYYSALAVGYAIGLNANLSSIGFYTATNSTKGYFNGASAASSSPLDNLTFSTYAQAGMNFIISGCYQTN